MPHTDFDPVGAFQGARQNALTIQRQEQGIQRETAAIPVRANQVRQQQTQFDQVQAVQKARVLNQSAKALGDIELGQRASAFQRLAPQLQEMGIDPAQFDNATFSDQELQEVIASTQGLIDDPSKLSAAQLEFTALTKDLSEEDKLRARRIELRLDPGAGVITGEQRTATTPGLTEDVAGSKAKIAESVAERKVVGKDKGQAIVDLPQTLETANNSLATIDAVLNHPGLESATGLNSVINPANFIPGTDAHDFALASQQLQGQAFLVAFDSLKGGGQITEPEGKKATEAIAQLSRAQSTPQYRKALRTLRDIMVRAKDRAIDKAGAAPSSEVDPALLEFMTEEERALFSGV